MKPIVKWMLVLLSLVLLSAGLLSGSVLAVHTSYCRECAQLSGPAGCPIFTSLRSIFQKLAVALAVSSSLLIALLSPLASLRTSLPAERRHAISLVGWNVKLSC